MQTFVQVNMCTIPGQHTNNMPKYYTTSNQTVKDNS